MVERPERDEAAVRHLLGLATEQEKTALEETLFKDSKAFEEIAAIEDDLIDDYLSGALTGNERSSFEAAYFATAERRARVDFARTLRQRLAGTGVRPPLRLPRPRAFRTFPILLAAAAVLFAILAFVFGMDAARAHRQANKLLAERNAAAQRELELSRRVGEAQAQAEQLGRQVAEERSETERLSREVEELQASSSAKIASLTLIAGLVRGSGNLPAVRVAPDTVSLRLTAPMQVSYASYGASVQTPEGKTLWRGPARPSAARGQSIVVTLPAKDIPSGDYILSVTGVTAAGREESAADFSFRVKK
jgi:hypothetical protein